MLDRKVAAIRGMYHFLNFFCIKVWFLGSFTSIWYLPQFEKIYCLALWSFLFNSSSSRSCKNPSLLIAVFVSHRPLCYAIIIMPQKDIRISYLPARAIDLWTKLIFMRPTSIALNIIVEWFYATQCKSSNLYIYIYIYKWRRFGLNVKEMYVSVESCKVEIL